ncbi:MAG: hypothetical protein GTO13_03455 [Proteobacteria bacterium]|nr:hypothetical protein [Pseudomonadota bacterium]
MKQITLRNNGVPHRIRNLHEISQWKIPLKFIKMIHISPKALSFIPGRASGRI